MAYEKAWYYKIDERDTERGFFELWQNEEWGDEAEALLTLNGKFCSWTWDDICTAIDEYGDEA